MHKNNHFFQSLAYAVSGFAQAARRERNLRFHIVIGNLIILFAYFFGLTRAEWGILLTTIGIVIAAELLNTAIENAVDTATKEIDPYAKTAKDTAAAAVMVAAVGAVAVGIVLFLDVAKIQSALHTIFTNQIPFICAGVLFIADILFLMFGGQRGE